MTTIHDSRCFVLVLVPNASASTRLPYLVYINVPLSTYSKIDAHRNLKQHRAVFPAKTRLSSYYLVKLCLSKFSILTYILTITQCMSTDITNNYMYSYIY